MSRSDNPGRLAIMDMGVYLAKCRIARMLRHPPRHSNIVLTHVARAQIVILAHRIVLDDGCAVAVVQYNR